MFKLAVLFIAALTFLIPNMTEAKTIKVKKYSVEKRAEVVLKRILKASNTDYTYIRVVIYPEKIAVSAISCDNGEDLVCDIGLTRGLITLIKSDHELAFVLANELALLSPSIMMNPIVLMLMQNNKVPREIKMKILSALTALDFMLASGYNPVYAEKFLMKLKAFRIKNKLNPDPIMKLRLRFIKAYINQVLRIA